MRAPSPSSSAARCGPGRCRAPSCSGSPMAAWLYSVLVVLGLAAPPRPELDRVAAAVEGAESSRGHDAAMWRARPQGPQGPMQVSAAAAADVGADDRRLGRAYLALLHRRYGNWTDAVIAYNWGPGNFARWQAAGRPLGALSAPLRAYLDRVLREATLLPEAAPPVSPPAEPPPAAIRDPALRKTYLADREAIARLRAFLEGGDGADAEAAIGVIRRVAARPGFGEFAFVRTPRRPRLAAVRQIAGTMLDKLRAECATIALVDRRRRVLAP